MNSWPTSENSFKANFRECPKGEVRRIPIPRSSVNKGLLDCLLALPGRIGTQPQRDVGWLHSLPYTTPTRSSLKAFRSVSSRNWAEKASRVFLASYLLRKKRRSMKDWMRRLRG